MFMTSAKTILSAKNGINIYRGCTHGCIYCDSRSECYCMDHAFENVEVKLNAPELLEEALKRKRKPCMIGTGSMSDPYMHCEEELCLTKKCLEIIEKYGFGFSTLTKSDRVLRDIDIFERINKKAKAVLQMTLTTYDEELCRKIEPNVSSTRRRYEVLKAFNEKEIPSVVWLCPVLPFINDSEENLSGLLSLCFDAGVRGIVCFGFGVTLRSGNREHFYSELDRKFPGIKEKYIETYGDAYECISQNNTKLRMLFESECRKHKVMTDRDKIFAYLNEFPLMKNQISFI